MADYKLTDDELNSALTFYASGRSTTSIINEIIEGRSNWDSTPAVREKIRSQLRCVNPTDPNFAMTKYGDAYNLARDALVGVVAEEAREVCRSTFEKLIADLGELDDIGLALTNMIENSSGEAPTSNSEFINTVRAYVSLQKVKIEGVNAVSELAKQIADLIPPVSY